MYKDLRHKDYDNTRQVLFEKKQIHYYRKLGTGQCLENCKVHNAATMIGSHACSICNFCRGFDIKEGYIICTRIKQAIKK